MNSALIPACRRVINGLRRAEFVRNCPTHGDYTPYLSTPAGADVESPCPSCFRDLISQERREQFAEMRRRVLDSRVKEAQVPEKYWKLGFAEFLPSTEKIDRAVSVGKRFVKDFATHRFRGTSLIIYGNCGTGKTHLACAILREILNTGRSCLYITAMDLMRKIKSTWGKDGSEKERAALASLVEPDLLVIDEVGVQHGADGGTNSDLTIITEVIDKRGWSNRPNIVVTNLDLDELPIWVGERVVSRLREHGGILAMEGPDWRKKRPS